MSRIGVMPVSVPKGVEVIIDRNHLQAKGPLGHLELLIKGNIKVSLDKQVISVKRSDDEKDTKSLHGLYRKLISNMVTGVSDGFKKNLLVNGVGYRAEVAGSTLTLNLGFSNPINYSIRDGIKITAEGGTRISVVGCDKQLVGQVASEIRSFRPPEPYKGKGVRYENEQIRRKAGKATVSGS